ncbi:MAG TPA: helix-turn-helix transcriptional regulator [Solirubrobacterales bacterium]|jgi:transcriptional regulator with XRE-family HTH domain|nr:helix-turn-helix transcriptional regulator [Solirubrobacterales bacterium]
MVAESSLPNPALGQVIRRLREAQGLQQEMLARHADLSVTTVSYIERRMVNPSWSTVEKIVRALGVSLVEIARQIEEQEAAGRDAD